jgi:hypothetical protein
VALTIIGAPAHAQREVGVGFGPSPIPGTPTAGPYRATICIILVVDAAYLPSATADLKLTFHLDHSAGADHMGLKVAFRRFGMGKAMGKN